MIYINGYTIERQIISSQETAYLKTEINKELNFKNASGLRHLQYKVSAIYDLAYYDRIQKTLANYCDTQLKLVRAIYFNKTGENNWRVAWHQDKTIAVKQKIEIAGFNNWSIKEGIVHVQPPLEIMQDIVTLRIHLDAANEENGALQVIPKSHKLGILTQETITQIKTNKQSTICSVNTGDAVIMSPLILHSSLKAKKPSNRRVIHLEYASKELPGGLDWW
ncbi:MAG: phytanoyl-CoA dioxygenase family protein [Waterburya sp.]